jgi:threonine dehydrogenase-like Zn-dependent dehydrogenase
MLLGGFDIIQDTVGKHGMFNLAIRLLRARGTYVKVGYQMTSVKFDETPIWWQELNIIGVDSYGIEKYQGKKIQSFDLVIKLLKEGKLNFDHFITHRYKLSEYKKGFTQCLRKPNETIKVVLENDL